MVSLVVFSVHKAPNMVVWFPGFQAPASSSPFAKQSHSYHLNYTENA